jgi:hypothetical protein
LRATVIALWDGDGFVGWSKAWIIASSREALAAQVFRREKRKESNVCAIRTLPRGRGAALNLLLTSPWRHPKIETAKY